ncbi:hypothetical protein ACFE04_022284 [Oxalis oulophora]
MNIDLISSSQIYTSFCFGLIALVMALCIIIASFLFPIVYILSECLSWPSFLDSCERGVENGLRRSNYQLQENNNNNNIPEGVPQGMDERQFLRFKVLEKLLPRMFYRRGEYSSQEDCSICLADYVEGEACRVLPICCHTFHLKCIDGWLKNHLTCPLCRRCIVDP